MMLSLFGAARPILGMIHLGALPGSPGYGGALAPVVDAALADAETLARGGVHGLMVENFGDMPFPPERVGPETVAAMTRVVTEIRRRADLPLGINVLRNDARAALAVAAATGAAFVRVNVHIGLMAADQGLLAGRAHRTLRYRAALGAPTRIFADLFVKHATPLYQRTLEEMVEELGGRGRADAVIVTGRSTGSAPEVDTLQRARRAARGAPVLVGSGLTRENAATLLPCCDGAIVGTSLNRGGAVQAPVDAERVRALLAAASAVPVARVAAAPAAADAPTELPGRGRP
ncbi:MAG: BtpA/SgcQ family protein [Planctomycetes bacterium]|nr:BtpA/SgcQ family protein [Planctomycetota bacterium]